MSFGAAARIPESDKNDIAKKVWDRLLTDITRSDSIGINLKEYTSTRAANLDNLDALISSRMTFINERIIPHLTRKDMQHPNIQFENFAVLPTKDGGNMGISYAFRNYYREVTLSYSTGAGGGWGNAYWNLTAITKKLFFRCQNWRQWNSAWGGTGQIRFIDTATGDYYAVELKPPNSAADFKLFKVVAGSRTDLATESVDIGDNADAGEIEILIDYENDFLMVLRDGVVKFAVNDSAIGRCDRIEIAAYWTASGSNGTRISLPCFILYE